MAGGNWMPELIEIAGGHNLVRAGRQAFRLDAVAGAGGGRPGRDRGGALRLWASRDASRSCRCCRQSPDGQRSPPCAEAASTSRWQRLFQPPRPAPRRLRRDPGGDAHPEICQAGGTRERLGCRRTVSLLPTFQVGRGSESEGRTNPARRLRLAPHPNPLPVKYGERGTDAEALKLNRRRSRAWRRARLRRRTASAR
jgi:hypothetical protein